MTVLSSIGIHVSSLTVCVPNMSLILLYLSSVCLCSEDFFWLSFKNMIVPAPNMTVMVVHIKVFVPKATVFVLNTTAFSPYLQDLLNMTIYVPNMTVLVLNMALVVPKMTEFVPIIMHPARPKARHRRRRWTARTGGGHSIFFNSSWFTYIRSGK